MALKRMIDFRNIAMHEEQCVQLPITVTIIRSCLDKSLRYSPAVPLRDAP